MNRARSIPAYCSVLVFVLACGLERDWAAWEALPMTEPGMDTSSGTEASTGSSTTEAASSGSTGTPGSGSGTASGASGTSDSTTTSGPVETTGTGTETSTGPAAVCGDGVLEGEEECDDLGQTSCFNCVWDRLVFVTSKSDHGGDFAADADMDYYCNHLAAVAGLLMNSQPRFKAWVSTTTQSAAERLYHSPGRYVLRNGLVFAQSWDALVAGQILNPLNVDENSQTKNASVWTDTRPDGSAMPGNHCEDWTSPSFELKAYLGNSTATDGSWTLDTGEATNPVDCLDTAALYCFESP